MTRSFIVRSGSDLGAAVRQARIARGLSQTELAALSQIERTYLARLEHGNSVALLDRALQLLRDLGAEVTVSITPETVNNGTDKQHG